MTTPRILTVAVLTASLGLVPAVASAVPVKFTAGAAGAGDPYFPKMGNGGGNTGGHRGKNPLPPAARGPTPNKKNTPTATKKPSPVHPDPQRPAGARPPLNRKP